MIKETIKEEFVNGKLNLKTIKGSYYSIYICTIDKVVECVVAYNGKEISFMDKTFRSAEKAARELIAPPKVETQKTKKDWLKWLHKEPTKNVVEIPKEMVALANQLTQMAKQ